MSGKVKKELTPLSIEHLNKKFKQKIIYLILASVLSLIIVFISNYKIYLISSIFFMYMFLLEIMSIKYIIKHKEQEQLLTD